MLLQRHEFRSSAILPPILTPARLDAWKHAPGVAVVKEQQTPIRSLRSSDPSGPGGAIYFWWNYISIGKDRICVSGGKRGAPEFQYLGSPAFEPPFQSPGGQLEIGLGVEAARGHAADDGSAEAEERGRLNGGAKSAHGLWDKNSAENKEFRHSLGGQPARALVKITESKGKNPAGVRTQEKNPRFMHNRAGDRPLRHPPVTMPCRLILMRRA